MTVEAFPLSWPAHVKRHMYAQRVRASFGKATTGTNPDGTVYYAGRDKLTVGEAVKRLLGEVDRVGALYVVISCNIEPRQDGRPRSNQREPADPGVAVYFQLKGKPYCLPCDRYDRVADNIAAVTKHIEATRAIERYGVGTVEQAFQGFASLPPPSTSRPWRQVFGLHREPRVTLDMLEERYRALARERHPDLGGGHEMMTELNTAREAARKELGA